MSSDLSERTKKYVEALIQLGPNFDFDAWLAEVRAEEAKLNGSQISPEASGTSAGSTGGPLGRHELDIGGQVEPKEAVGQSVGSTVPTSVKSTAPASKRLWHFNPISPKCRDVVAEELSTVEKAFTAFQSSRRRDAVYAYLGAVFDLVRAWREQGKCRSRTARIAAKFGFPPKKRDPYTAIIEATADVDAKARSKWSRALLYVEEANVHDEYLRGFMKRTGGINDCAHAFRKQRRRARKDR